MLVDGSREVGRRFRESCVKVCCVDELSGKEGTAFTVVNFDERLDGRTVSRGGSIAIVSRRLADADVEGFGSIRLTVLAEGIGRDDEVFCFDDRVDSTLWGVGISFFDERVEAVEETLGAFWPDLLAEEVETSGCVPSATSSDARAVLQRRHSRIILSYRAILSSSCLVCAAAILGRSDEVFYQMSSFQELLILLNGAVRSSSYVWPVPYM